MAENKRITIKDIAAETGFTAQAVSRALRDKPDISVESKRAIVAAAAKLGYIKNDTASSLRGGKTHTVAIVYDNLANPYFSVMTGYLQEAFKALGYTLLIFTSESHSLDDATFDMLISRNADGAISFLEPGAGIEALARRYQMPVIVLGRKPDGGIDYIRTDDVEGGRLAARRLIGRGCRRILYLSIPEGVTCARERYEGFKSELDKAGLFDERLTVFLGGNDLERRLGAIIGQGLIFDGIFAFNDMIAFEALYILNKAGVKGVKVVGYDNIQEDIKIPLRLTTVGSDKRQMAFAAAEALAHKIETGDLKPFQKVHDVFLVEGETA